MIIQRIKETEPGTWLVHEFGQEPVRGVAVWEYNYGLRCQEHGIGPCRHIKMVECLNPGLSPNKSRKLSNSH